MGNTQCSSGEVAPSSIQFFPRGRNVPLLLEAFSRGVNSITQHNHFGGTILENGKVENAPSEDFSQFESARPSLEGLLLGKTDLGSDEIDIILGLLANKTIYGVFSRFVEFLVGLKNGRKEYVINGDKVSLAFLSGEISSSFDRKNIYKDKGNILGYIYDRLRKQSGVREYIQKYASHNMQSGLSFTRLGIYTDGGILLAINTNDFYEQYSGKITLNGEVIYVLAEDDGDHQSLGYIMNYYNPQGEVLTPAKLDGKTVSFIRCDDGVFRVYSDGSIHTSNPRRNINGIGVLDLNTGKVVKKGIMMDTAIGTISFDSSKE